MQYTTNNIFSTATQQSVSTLHAITESTKDFGLSLLKKLQQMIESLTVSEETSQKISENLIKAKQFFKQNKEVVLGVTLIAGLYVARVHSTKSLRNSKSRHIHSLISNPNSQLKRSGSHKKQLTQLPQINQTKKLTSQRKSKKPSNPKLHYLRAFISQAEQEEDQYIRSDEEDKENPDLSTSTRRTESMVSDIECMKKRKRKNLQPILDLVEEEQQTQDRVFFEMFRTYRES